MKEQTKKKGAEKYCIVPSCPNTNVKNPNKIYFSVPKKEHLRTKWCNAMKRDVKKNAPLSNLTSLYCCEDHFNIEEDMENFWEFKLMGNVRVRLKKNVVPHIFECQEASRGVAKEREEMKQKRKRLIEEVLKEVENVPIGISEACTSKEESEMFVQCDILTLPLEVEYKTDKAVQANVKVRFRSKAVNTTKGVDRGVWTGY